MLIRGRRFNNKINNHGAMTKIRINDCVNEKIDTRGEDSNEGNKIVRQAAEARVLNGLSSLEPRCDENRRATLLEATIWTMGRRRLNGRK